MNHFMETLAYSKNWTLTRPFCIVFFVGLTYSIVCTSNSCGIDVDAEKVMI